MQTHREIRVFATLAELAAKAAETITEKIQKLLREKEKVSLVLSGGSTPRPLYELLATDEYRNRIAWNKLLVFFSDERCVPPDDPDSNYKMAYDNLLSRVPIPEKNIFRLRGEIDPEEAATDYESVIKKILGKELSFDLVLLGMGADGHIASLFPATTALQETKKLVAANYVDKLKAHRLTLTLPILNRARNVIFLVSGKDKAKAVSSVFTDASLQRLPARLIKPVEGNVVWFLDKEAASLLDETAVKNFSSS